METAYLEQGKGRHYELREGWSSIGHEYNNHLFYDDDELANPHAYFCRSGHVVWLIDCGSQEGTRVNGGRITHRRLEEGDLIEMGRQAFSLILADSEDETYRAPIDRDALQRQEQRRLALPRLPEGLLAVYGSRSKTDLLEKTLRTAAEVILADRGVAFLAKEAVLDQVTYYDAAGLDESHAASAVVRMVSNYAMDRKKLVFTEDALIDTRFQYGSPPFLCNMRSSIAAPILLEEEVAGILYLDRRIQSGVFEKRDETLVREVLRHGTIALTALHGERGGRAGR